ncbi:MAG: hypothetical protein BMS9Abin01_1092 [Gammaproteobacteria bacterium]|nr:MAG: hypothetical protein BMS9Abin01_1092 [Gammaproteobacteria bacterium]
MAVTRVDYSEQAVAAAHSVLLELVHLLGEYRDSIVLIGGMVPRLLIPQAEEAHIGTLDVDLALDHRRFEEAGYRTVHELLTSRGYERDDQQPFIYRRRFNLEGRPVTVQVDLLSGEYGGTGRSRRTQRVQDVRPRKARGADLAFEQPLDVEISGALPDGGEDKASVRVATIVPFLIMKGMALRDRLKEKDAYDIYYCLRHYPGAPDTILDAFGPYVENKLVKEGLECIGEKFASPDHVGPKHVADFLEIGNSADREQLQRDAYERAAHVLENLGLKPQKVD